MVEYVDYAEYYDYDTAFLDDIQFYLEYARQTGSPVLELACGTGRVLVPLAEAGIEITGLDFSENMLSVCRRKIAGKGLSGRAALVHADMTTFDLPRKDFALAYIPLRSFMHLHTQTAQLACLRRAHAHLRPGGIFIVDVYAPDFKMLAHPVDGSVIFSKEYDLPNGNHVTRHDRLVSHDLTNQVRTFEFRFEEHLPTGELARERTLPLSTRYTFRYELGLLLDKAGFEALDFYRDYAKNPFDGTGEIIAVARRV